MVTRMSRNCYNYVTIHATILVDKEVASFELSLFYFKAQGPRKFQGKLEHLKTGGN